MQKHFEREQKLNQMTDKEREQFLLEEKKIESEKEVKHKLDPVCINNKTFLKLCCIISWDFVFNFRYTTQEVKSTLKKYGKNKMKWKEKILTLGLSLQCMVCNLNKILNN